LAATRRRHIATWRRHLVLAGRRLCIEGDGRVVHDAVMPALSHLVASAVPAETPLRWTVRLATERDRSDARQGIVRLPDGGLATVPRPPGGESVEPAHGIRFRLPGGGLAMMQQTPFAMESFEPDRGIQLVAVPAGFAAGDLRAHPGALGLAAWLAGPATQILHVGAVAFAGRGVLVVGPGGAGKTTSVLACCMRAGGDFLGDDLCLVEVGDSPGEAARVHSLFATVKLNADSARRLSADHWPRLGTTPKNKIVAALPASVRAVTSATVEAIIVLAPPGCGPAGVAALRPAEAVRAITATGASHSGAISPRLWFSTATRLARRAPAFRLPVSWDLERLATGIRHVAEEAVGNR
jgi:hypothetical protein